MDTLLIATTNRGKLAEIRGILAGVPYRLVALDEIDAPPEPDEDGESFAENARLKAVAYATATGLLTVAEDSGLEIDALGGLPGVQSARWHGTDYAVKFRRIYELLDTRGLDTSAARFVCTLALARGERVLFEARGTVEGEIARQPRGTHGFGYDPIFFYPPYARTLGEVEEEEKRAVSHRGKAFRALAEFLSRCDPGPRT